MSEPCSACGDQRLVTVRIPGHDDIEAVICLTCSAVQAAGIETAGRPDGQHWPPRDPPAGP